MQHYCEPNKQAAGDVYSMASPPQLHIKTLNPKTRCTQTGIWVIHAKIENRNAHIINYTLHALSTYIHALAFIIVSVLGHHIDICIGLLG